MPHTILDGLSLVDPTGRVILGPTVSCLIAAITANLFLHARYASLQKDLEQNRELFANALLNQIVRDASDAARRTTAPNTQAIIEERFQSELRTLLLAERFVRAATGLVIILGLLGTFYGLTLSVGRIVQLVSADAAGGADVAGAMTTGLTHALSGMAVAFSNSLLGILSAVILTVVGIFSNVTDRRIGLMLQIETHVDRLLASAGPTTTRTSQPDVTLAIFREAVAQLEQVIARFEAGLSRFSETSRDFDEFNAHLKDNIQRMSLSFGDFSACLNGQIVALKTRDGQ
jgi:hypothetical protein